MVVKNAHDLAAISMEDTMTVEKTFDRVSTLLLAVDLVEKKFWLKLTGPYNGLFKLTDGVSGS